MADGTADVFGSSGLWEAQAADLEWYIGVGAPPYTALEPSRITADIGLGEVVTAAVPAVDVAPQPLMADIGLSEVAPQAFKFGGVVVLYVMRADGTLIPDVVWEVTTEPDPNGDYAPSPIVPGTAVVSSHRVRVS